MRLVAARGDEFGYRLTLAVRCAAEMPDEVVARRKVAMAGFLRWWKKDLGAPQLEQVLPQLAQVNPETAVRRTGSLEAR
jgi:hypothetical protein